MTNYSFPDQINGGDQLTYEDNPDFNSELDANAYLGDGNQLKVVNSSFMSSKVLFCLEYETYRLAFLEYKTHKKEEYKSTIWNEFPMPIAYSFYRVENGYENYIQRLHLLRDTWEFLIQFLFSMVVSEYRCSLLPMSGIKIKLSDILSDRMNNKLSVIEQLLQKSENKGYSLESGKIIPQGIIENIRDLNQARNGFSHQAAKSEEQAARLFAEYFEDVFGILEKMHSLQDVTLMKFISSGNNTLKPRFEVFNGHSMSTTIREICLTPEEHASCSCFLNNGSLLLRINSKIFSLKPFMHFIPNESSSYKKLCFYKKREGEGSDQQFIYEIIRESIEIKLSSQEFKPEVELIQKLLLNLPAEGGSSNYAGTD